MCQQESVATSNQRVVTTPEEMSTARSPKIGTPNGTADMIERNNNQTQQDAATDSNLDKDHRDNMNGEFLDLVDDGMKEGWVVVMASSVIFFVYLGLTYSYGIVQLHLSKAGLASISTLSFIGSLAAGISPLMATVTARVIRKIGYRATVGLGSFLIGLGELTASWSTRSVAAMFLTQGLVFGLGAALCFLVRL